MGKRSTIQKNSLSEQAYQTLKERILSGETPPGTRLIIEGMAVDLGISRTPVRDGISKLISSGLVSCSGSGYIVATYTSKDVKELFAIRKALEVLAIRETTKYIDPKTLDKFRGKCDNTASRILGGEDGGKLLREVDKQFHDLISNGCMNVRLQKFISDVLEMTLFIRNWGYLMKNVVVVETASIDEYRMILRAMYEHDADEAARLLEVHLTTGETVTLDALRL